MSFFANHFFKYYLIFLESNNFQFNIIKLRFFIKKSTTFLFKKRGQFQSNQKWQNVDNMIINAFIIFYYACISHKLKKIAIQITKLVNQCCTNILLYYVQN